MIFMENENDEIKITRSIHGLYLDNWNQFVYWSRRLGYTHANMLAEMMRFYFEKNKELIETQTKVVNIKVAPKKSFSKLKISEYCLQDIDAARKKIEAATSNQIVLGVLEYLNSEYSTNKKHRREDREAILSFIAEIRQKNQNIRSD